MMLRYREEVEEALDALWQPERAELAGLILLGVKLGLAEAAEFAATYSADAADGIRKLSPSDILETK